MAKKKKQTLEQELQQYRDCLMESYERWGEIKIDGCNDPAWTDGQNLNLVRGHIMHDRFKIYEICLLQGRNLPPESALPAPPEAPAGYMANLEQTERVKRLQAYGCALSTDWRR